MCERIVSHARLGKNAAYRGYLGHIESGRVNVGSFILIDEVSNETVAGGMVVDGNSDE